MLALASFKPVFIAFQRSMQRFRDEWVYDKVMFDFTSRSGGCSCCSMQHVNLGLINQCSDMDAAEAVAQDDECPWPEEIKLAVWSDRVSLRKKLKADRPRYAEFWTQYGDDFAQWLSTVPLDQLKQICLVPTAEFRQYLATEYRCSGAFQVLTCAVMEQVRNFRATGYDADGNSPAERAFERGIVEIQMRSLDPPHGIVDCLSLEDEYLQDSVSGFAVKLKEYALSTKLLPPPENSAEADEEKPGRRRILEADARPGSMTYRPDRRAIRMALFRLFVDDLVDMYMIESGGIDQTDEPDESAQ